MDFQICKFLKSMCRTEERYFISYGESRKVLLQDLRIHTAKALASSLVDSEEDAIAVARYSGKLSNTWSTYSQFCDLNSNARSLFCNMDHFRMESTEDLVEKLAKVQILKTRLPNWLELASPVYDSHVELENKCRARSNCLEKKLKNAIALRKANFIFWSLLFIITFLWGICGGLGIAPGAKILTVLLTFPFVNIATMKYLKKKVKINERQVKFNAAIYEACSSIRKQIDDIKNAAIRLKTAKVPEESVRETTKVCSHISRGNENIKRSNLLVTKTFIADGVI